MHIAYGLIACAVTLSACNTQAEDDQQPAIQAGMASVSYAREDGVDFRAYSLSSVTELGYGQMTVADRSQTTPFIEKVRASLKHKKYWEACYGVAKEGTVGAMYCYYLDYKSFDLLTTYRTK